MTNSKTRKTSDGEPKRDAYEKVTDRIVALLDEGVVPWRCPFDATPASGALAPFNPLTGTVYRGVNWLMLSVAALTNGWGGSWVTVAQARQAGGHVRKGERGTPLMFWKPSRRTLKPEEAAKLRAEGKKVRTDDEGTPYVESIVARGFTVFNLAQMEGLVEAEKVAAPAITWAADHDTDGVIADYLERSATKLTTGGAKAFYAPATHTVTMPDAERFGTAGDWYAVAFHELGHSTGAPHLLDRDLTGTFGTPSYAREELTAELAAAMVCSTLTITAPERLEVTAAYIANWRKVLTDEPRLLATAAQRAQKAADLLLNAA